MNTRTGRAWRTFAAAAVTLALSGSAGAVELDSGNEHVAVVELFTSEGCSSCPPADRWMSTLTDDKRLWKQIVPVAFHVDYWDHIGWPDRFAYPAYSARQREHRRLGNVYSVYTPGFVVNGREWRGWFRDPELRIPYAAAPGRLQVEVAPTRLTARYRPAAPSSEPLTLTLAILGAGLETEVRAGENAGRRLRHDFVVLRLFEWDLQAAGDEYTLAEDFTLPRSRAPRLGAAVWVSARQTQRPLQAAGGWLD